MARMARLDPGSALIVVDVQNDFADPAGSLHVPSGDQVPGPIDELVSEAVAGGAVVVYTQDWHPASTPHFAKDGGIWPVHCVAGTWGAALHPALAVRGPVVRKGANGEDGYSGFTMRDTDTGQTIPTPLESMLVERHVERVVVCGLATDYCVSATALDATRLGLDTTVLLDLVRAVDLAPGDGDRALAGMAAAGVTLDRWDREPGLYSHGVSTQSRSTAMERDPAGTADMPAGTAIDPVCGMTVQLDQARGAGLTLVHEGVEYGFCGRGCRLEFEDDPARFLSPDYIPSM
jgi:nicotinamidase/pyrazinamidase